MRCRLLLLHLWKERRGKSTRGQSPQNRSHCKCSKPVRFMCEKWKPNDQLIILNLVTCRPRHRHHFAHLFHITRICPIIMTVIDLIDLMMKRMSWHWAFGNISIQVYDFYMVHNSHSKWNNYRGYKIYYEIYWILMIESCRSCAAGQCDIKMSYDGIEKSNQACSVKNSGVL